MRERWPIRELGDVCRVVGGGTPPKDKEEFYKGNIPWATVRDMRQDIISQTEFNITELAVKFSSTNVIPANNVVIATRVGLGKVCFITQDTAINQDLRGILPIRTKELSAHFLFWWFKSVAHLIEQEGTGATVQGVKLPFIKSLQVPLPSFPEQKRIAAILDEAFEGIDTAVANAEKNLANARELFETSLKAVFARRGARWEKIRLEVLLERGWIEGHLDGNHGGDYPRKEEFISTGVPYISANCVVDDHIDMGRAKYLAPSRAALLRKGVARDRDVIFAHNATVGPVAILYTDQKKVILSTSLTYYRCNENYVLPEYLSHFMRSSIFKVQYLQIMRQSTRNQIPITKQREFYHVIPPLVEQKIVVDQLDGIFENGRRLEAIYQQKLNALADLKQAILQRAFAGELTVGFLEALPEAAE